MKKKHDRNLRLVFGAVGSDFLELNSVVVSNIFFISTLGEVIQFHQYFSDGWFNHHLVNYFDQFSMDVFPPKFDMEPENDGFQVRNLRNSRGLIFRFLSLETVCFDDLEIWNVSKPAGTQRVSLRQRWRVSLMRKWPRWRDKTRLRRSSLGAHGRWMCHLLDVNSVSKDRVTPQKTQWMPRENQWFYFRWWILLSPSPFLYGHLTLVFQGFSRKLCGKVSGPYWMIPHPIP